MYFYWIDFVYFNNDFNFFGFRVFFFFIRTFYRLIHIVILLFKKKNDILYLDVPNDVLNTYYL